METNLQHHGISGMHWGQRNGPPYPLSSSQKTSAEKKSGGSSSGGDGGDDSSSKKSTKQKAVTKAEEAARKQATEQKKKDSKNRMLLSDDDLKKKINRLESEKKLRELTEKEVEPGKSFIKQVLTDSGKKIMTNAVSGIGLYTLKKLAEKKDPDLGSAIFNGGPKGKK